MCGIAGCLNWEQPVSVDAVRKMTRRLAHRGPDAEGIVTRGPITLGHRRLSIIDLRPEGNQPLTDVSGRYWISFNGEIYNYRELRAQLIDKGARFQTETDTEVILEAYKHWGDDCLRYFNGMFAFALWDEHRQKLLLARDRLGEKPLFYAELPGQGIVFASELKALRLYPGVGSELDHAALSQFLSLNYIVGPRSIFAGVTKLPPAHSVVIECNRPWRVSRYWELADFFQNKRHFHSQAEAAEELTSLMHDSARLRMVADVPVGAFLSGGVDSGIIVSEIARLRPGETNRTLTIGFLESGFSEVSLARQTAMRHGTLHTDKVVEPDMSHALPDIVRAMDEPFADSSMIPMYYLAEFARQHVTVCLSGDGGDEAFAGYSTYSADRLRRFTSWLPVSVSRGLAGIAERLPVRFSKVGFAEKMRRFFYGNSLPADRAHYSWRIIFPENAKHEVLDPNIRESVLSHDPFDVFHAYQKEVEDCHYLDQAMYVDMKTWLVDDILVKVDRATMAHSLEARTPFLDHRLVEFAAALPVHWKYRGFEQKYLLRHAYRDSLPPTVLNQRKRGFNAPVSHWLHSTLGNLGRQVSTSARMRAWFNIDYINKLWDEHHSMQRDHGLPLFGLTCLGLWLETGE